MKILKLCVFALAVFTLSACSSDDDNPTPAIELNNTNLEGNYELVHLSGSSEISVTTSGASVVVETETYTGDTFTNARVNFNANGTYNFEGSYRETTVTTITGQSPETESEIVNFDQSTGNYVTNNTSRTITLDGDIIYDVTLFDGVNLHLTENYTESFNNSTETGEVTIRLRKLN